MKHAYLILIFTIFVLLVAGCGSGNDSKPGVSGSDTGSESPRFADEPTKQGGTGSGAGASDLLQTCLGISNNMLMNMCAAAMNRDYAMCDNVKHEQPNDEKYFQAMCKIWVAAANKDFDKCADIDTTIQGKKLLDCEPFVAEAMQDSHLCDRLGSENASNGCKHRIKINAGDFDLSYCKSSACVFNYALRNNDVSACSKFPDVTTAYLAENEYACKGMVAGESVAYCRKAPGGLFGFQICSMYAGMGRAISYKGSKVNFEPSECDNDDRCTRAVLIEMVKYLAGN